MESPDFRRCDSGAFTGRVISEHVAVAVACFSRVLLVVSVACLLLSYTVLIR